MSPATILNHEMTHATRHEDALKKYYSGQLEEYQKFLDKYKDISGYEYHNVEEYEVINGAEKRTAEKLGEIKKGDQTRTDHESGEGVKVECPTSNIPVNEKNNEETQTIIQ